MRLYAILDLCLYRPPSRVDHLICVVIKSPAVEPLLQITEADAAAFFARFAVQAINVNGDFKEGLPRKNTFGRSAQAIPFACSLQNMPPPGLHDYKQRNPRRERCNPLGGLHRSQCGTPSGDTG